MDIGAWLRGLGLERYEEAFRDNDVDAKVLPHLTAEDLKEIGITSVGHRRSLLAAITALRPESASPEPEPSAAAPRAPEPSREAERRQLTVMFVDLVGSTELAGRLDPEDVGEVIRNYQERCGEVVSRWDGHVAKYMGDGVLAYFGWPQAHEDDAERAVRAGLDLAHQVGRLTTTDGVPLAARVGIATGLVVVGDLVGEGAAQEQRVVGETPNLAARLQGLAEPGTVVIADGTRRLLGALFELDDMGAQDLKGFADAIRAWRVMGKSRTESRFEARHAAGLTPLIGRDEELALLLQRWARAREGEGQVALLVGEPGIGKSRITHALRERLAGEPHTPLRYQCSPYHSSSALYPVIDQLERAAGFRPDDTAETKLAKMEVLLAQGTGDVAAAAPLVAELLSIPAGKRYPPLALTSQRRREQLFGALLAQLEGLAARRPVLALYEDAHWLDPTTAELVELAVERVRDLPVLLVVTARPEFTPRWTSRPHVTPLTLNRLSRKQGVALVERVMGDRALPPEALEQIVARADGVPLFMEELTKTVLEAGVLRNEDDLYALAGSPAPLAIPATLRDSLMDRLDRSAPAKAVAQVAAAIGREFSHGLLAAVVPLGENELSDALARLMGGELIFRRGLPPQATYSFKHALVQDAAYESLLRGRRRELHARIAGELEERFPETAETEPELLAHHCTEAGLVEKAVLYRYRAGRRALARSALAEALAQLRQGLELLAGLPDGSERRRRELDLQVALGRVLMVMKGTGAPEAARALARARELCQEESDVRRLLAVLSGQTGSHTMRGELRAGHEIAEEMLDLARRQGDTGLLMVAHQALSFASLQLGRFVAAREHATEVLAVYDPARHRSPSSLYSADQRVGALGLLASSLFALGYPDQARRRNREHQTEARKLAQPITLGQALLDACIFHRAAGEIEALQQAAEAIVAVAAEHGFSLLLAYGKLFRGQALIWQGRTEGITEFKQGVAAVEATGTRLLLTNVAGVLAEAFVQAGRPREALSWVADALAWTGSPWFEAEHHRHNGELLLALCEPDPAEAEACFRRALETAWGQDAKMWELRAAASLARLWRDQGRRSEALDLLAPVQGWFTEGFDTADLKDAKALLDELG